MLRSFAAALGAATVHVPAGTFTMGRTGPAFPEVEDDAPDIPGVQLLFEPGGGRLFVF